MNDETSDKQGGLQLMVIDPFYTQFLLQPGLTAAKLTNAAKL